jgi:acetyl-CoA acetyltransferase
VQAAASKMERREVAAAHAAAHAAAAEAEEEDWWEWITPPFLKRDPLDPYPSHRRRICATLGELEALCGLDYVCAGVRVKDAEAEPVLKAAAARPAVVDGVPAAGMPAGGMPAGGMPVPLV